MAEFTDDEYMEEAPEAIFDRQQCLIKYDNPVLVVKRPDKPDEAKVSLCKN